MSESQNARIVIENVRPHGIPMREHEELEAGLYGLLLLSLIGGLLIVGGIAAIVRAVAS